MKKVVLALVMLAGAAGLVFSQQTDPNVAVTAHYQVYSSAGQQDAQAVANELEAFFSLYNGLFHFDDSTLKSKLNVRIYADKKDFDDYLSKLVAGTRDSFVFLQYTEPERNLLLGFHKPDDSSFTASLLHHGFVQFLRSFVAQPPLWLQEGFAVYFEASEWDATKNAALFHPNLAWASTLKAMINKYVSAQDTSAIIPLSTLLTMDADAANKQIQPFYAEAWGLVSFLADSDAKAYNRILWDTITSLSPSATVADNTSAVEKRAFSWVPDAQFGADFTSYINSVKSFPELVSDGMQAYTSGDLASSEKDFADAVVLNDKSSIPYYYLGLIKYATKDYGLAEHYFQTSLQMGADPGLVDYALGINAFADNRIDDAKSFLNQAVATNSPDYKDKASALLDRITKLSAQ